MIEHLPPLQPDPVIEAYKRDLDLSLLRENLRLTPEERLKKLIQHQQFALELRGTASIVPIMP